MRESSVKASERRQAPRTKLVEIAYIGMGPENGGLVLDVSDGGLSFHAVAPVRPAQTIRFLLSLRGHSRIEGAGEVVWTNEMRTVCGLRFTSLSSGAREHLNNWTNQSRMPAAPREKALSPAPAAIPQIVEPPAPRPSQKNTNFEPVFAIPPADEVYLSEPMDAALWQKPAFYRVIFGLLGAALAVAAFIYGVHVGESNLSSVARSAPNPGLQTESPMPAPTPIRASSVASDASAIPNGAPAAPTGAPSVPSDLPSVPNGAFAKASRADDASGNTLQRPGAGGHAAVATDLHAEQGLESGKADLAAALAFLNGDNGHRDNSAAVRLLWSAVANGNTAAEVILSDLYVSGDGVIKNCEQGRVLLIAAAKKGNVQAKMKLDELNANGCS